MEWTHKIQTPIGVYYVASSDSAAGIFEAIRKGQIIRCAPHSGAGGFHDEEARIFNPDHVVFVSTRQA